jgi:hypothetical protein
MTTIHKRNQTGTGDMLSEKQVAAMLGTRREALPESLPLSA